MNTWYYPNSNALLPIVKDCFIIQLKQAQNTSAYQQHVSLKPKNPPLLIPGTKL